LSETEVRESLTLSLGEFFAQSDALSQEAEALVKEQLALAEGKANEELALAKEQIAQQARASSNRETALQQEITALRQAELDANNKLFDKGLEYTILVTKVVPLRTQLVELQEEAVANKVKIGRCSWARRRLSLPHKLRPSRGPRQNSSTMLLTPTPQGSRILAQVACKHPEMNESPFATLNRVVDGQIVPGASL